MIAVRPALGSEATEALHILRESWGARVARKGEFIELATCSLDVAVDALAGHDGITIRHELEFERLLD